MPGKSWKGQLPTVFGQQLDPLFERVNEVIDKSLGQALLRYPKFFYANVKRFTLVGRTGSDASNGRLPKASRAAARCRGYPTQPRFGERCHGNA